MVQTVLFSRRCHTALCAAVVWFATFAGAMLAEETPVGKSEVDLPQRPPIALRRVAKLGPGPGKENSGIVKSRTRDDLFWIHNDSGDEPRVYAIHRNGADYADERYPETPGTLIGGAINVDWEDIAVDDAGHLIVADVGNNGNDRRDLVLYYLDEPSPDAGRTTFKKKIFVRYPEQTAFPAPRDNFNFDCEGVFTVGATVHLFSKNRSDTKTTLYRLDKMEPEVTNVLTRVDTFDIGGQVVGADCSPDGKRLVAITYEAIWLFERDQLDQEFFSSRISWAPHEGQQIEAVCFADGSTLLLADEELGELFEAELSGLTRVR